MISERLRKICELAGQGQTVADIGTDHGYVPIRLIESGAFRHAIASDIGEGPLQRARQHIEERGLSSRIETRLGSGLSRIASGEADTIVIAGMGGKLILEILEADLTVARSARTLVLSPQSDVMEFRKGILQMGFRILSETWMAEDGKDYILFLLQPGQDGPYSDAELYYGKTERLDRDSVSARTLRLNREMTIDREIYDRIAGAGSDQAAVRRKALETRLKLMEEIIGRKEGTS